MSEALVTLPDGTKAKVTFESPEQLHATIADLTKGIRGAAPEQKAAAWGPSSKFDQLSTWNRAKGFARDVATRGADDLPDIGRALKGEARGAIADPLVGIGSIVAHTVGAGDAADRFTQNREADIAKDRAAHGETGPDYWRMAGNAMAPTNYLIPGGAGTNALARIGLAARTGAAAALTQPVTGNGGFWTEKAKQAGAGAVAGGVLGGASELAGAALRPVSAAVRSGVDAVKRWLGAEMPSSLKSAAVHKVLETFGRDEAAGGPKLTEVMDVLDTARAAGKPMTLADAGKANVNALAGYLSRQPGEASATANQFLDARDASAGARLHSDITKYVAGGDSMKQTADALAKSRAAAAKPLYEEAMRPGSAAPLEDSLNAEFGRIQSERAASERELANAERGITSTAAKQSQAGNVGDLAMRGGDARAAAQGGAEAAKAKLAKLAQDEAKTTEVLRESQRARAAGERGGVWSPRIQQFLDDPIVKQGISKGLQVQRLEALAEGKSFNATDYAVTGADKSGEPVVGKVPNMRLLDSAKRGLDEILICPVRSSVGTVFSRAGAIV